MMELLSRHVCNMEQVVRCVAEESSNHNIKSRETACTKSHKRAFRCASEHFKDRPYVVVCEDDVSLPQHVNFDHLVSTAPTDWEVLKLYTSNPTLIATMYVDEFIGKNNMWVKNDADKDWGFVLYVVNPSSYDENKTHTHHYNTYTLTFPIACTSERFRSDVYGDVEVNEAHSKISAIIRDTIEASTP